MPYTKNNSERMLHTHKQTPKKKPGRMIYLDSMNVKYKTKFYYQKNSLCYSIKWLKMVCYKTFLGYFILLHQIKLNRGHHYVSLYHPSNPHKHTKRLLYASSKVENVTNESD